MMDANNRRQAILKVLQGENQAISASSFAKQFAVSRQIVVGDVAILRASGENIVATPRGYILQNKDINKKQATLVLMHNEEQMKDELYTFVDVGIEVVDVIVEHAIYGQIQANLALNSRYEVDRFLKKVETNKAKPLSDLTNGIHLHTILYDDEEQLKQVKAELKTKGYLYEK